MKALITGATGQDAWYLRELLNRRNIETIMLSRHGTADNPNVCIDQRDAIVKLVDEIRPAYIFHLAATSSTKPVHLQANQQSIVSGTCHLLEACSLSSRDTRIFICGSGLQFVNDNIAIKESVPFESSSAYACARIQSVYLARYFRQQHGLRVFVGYLYGHESPRRPSHFTSKMLVEAAIQAQNDPHHRVVLGDMTVIREFGYAADIINGIWHLVNQPIDDDTTWEANICTGMGLSLEQWSELAFSQLGLDHKQHCFSRNDYKPDYQMLVGDPAKMKSIGWLSQVSPKTLCQLMLGTLPESEVLERLYLPTQP